MTQNNNDLKLTLKEVRKLNQSFPIRVTLSNVAKPNVSPTPLTVGSRSSDGEVENKFVLTLTNSGTETLVVGGPSPGSDDLANPQKTKSSGIYLNFSDFASREQIGKIKFTTPDSPVITQIVKNISATISGEESAQTQPETENNQPAKTDPNQLPEPNSRHLGDEWICYLWFRKELEIRPEESLLIELENVSTNVRPALRYVDVSWDMRKISYREMSRHIESVNGFHQIIVSLEHPANYVEPPFPLQPHWLNNINTIYTSPNKLDVNLINELDFAITNIGLRDFVLDCDRFSAGAPYFEVIMPAVSEADEGDLSHSVADPHDLALAKLTNTTDREHGELWRVNEMIQGPLVKWEIRPDLESVRENGKINDAGKKVLLGIGDDAALTFKFTNLISHLPEGVALVYFRYYNMPEHDDGQIVLILEKRTLENGGDLLKQLDHAENNITSPLRWRVEEQKTIVSMGDKVEIDSLQIGDDKRSEDNFLDIVTADKRKSGIKLLHRANSGWTIQSDDETQHFSISRQDESSFNQTVSISKISGFVGIGSPNPHSKLEIGEYTDEADNYLAVNTSGGSNRKAGIQLKNGNEKNGWTIQSDEKTPDLKNHLSIWRHFKKDGADQSSEAVSISQNEGFVGIGAVTPTSKLEIGNFTDPTDNFLTIKTDGGNKWKAGIQLKHYNEKNGWTLQSDEKTDKFSIARQYDSNVPSEAVTILQSNGFVGIGTVNPTSKLEIGSFDENTDNFLSIKTAGGSQWKAGIRLKHYNEKIGWTLQSDEKAGRFSIARQYSTDVPSEAVCISSHNGFVGIGSTNPRCPLDVSISANYKQNQNFAHYSHNASPGKRDSGDTIDLSIYASNRIVASEFNAVSDARIKNVKNQSDGAADLLMLRNIAVTDYVYRDNFSKGTKTQKGFIAQEVEKFYPEAVSSVADFIPDIYAPPVSANLENTRLSLTLEKPHNLKTGDAVRLISNQKNFESPVTVIDENSFAVSDWNEAQENIFVYGKKVEDFKILDYNKIFALGLSATRELDKRQEALRKENAELKETVKSSESRIAELEKRLNLLTESMNKLQ